MEQATKPSSGNQNTNTKAEAASKQPIQRQAPSIRCPGCGQSVSLPAETCPTCSYNFRDGGPKKLPSNFSDFDEPSSHRIYFMAGGAILALLLVVVLVFFFSGNKTPLPTVEAPVASGGSIIQDIPSSSQNPLLNPAKTINTAKSIANKADSNVQLMEDTRRELERESGQ